MNGQWVQPREMELDRPSAARLQNAFLGGAHNFDVDRLLADRMERAVPGLQASFHESRAFLWRAVDELARRGIRQFLDVGSGVPAVGHVHEIARRRTADFRVQYVDNEPLTVAHSRPLLAGQPRVEIAQADLRDVTGVLAAARDLDLSRPVALLLCSVLHYLPGDPEPVVATNSWPVRRR